MGGVGTSNSRNRNGETRYYNMAACGGKRYQRSLYRDSPNTLTHIAVGLFVLYVCVLCAIHGKALITPSTGKR